MEQQSKTFEASILALEEIVKQLERGDLPLERAMQLFQQGTALVKQCSTLLNEAELTVVKLSKGVDGAPVETEFQYETE